MTLDTRSRGTPVENILDDALAGRALPSFPRVAMEAGRLLRDPAAPLPQVASVLRNDPAISTRLLQITNSPIYGLRSEVRNVEHAVSLLGRAQTESAVLAAAVRSAQPSPASSVFNTHHFWATSCARALIAKALGKLQGMPGTSELFTATLLQDMAVPLLLDAYGDTYAKILEAWHAGEAELHILEHAAFGWDHTEVGAGMCEAWRFPDEITTAIACHHGTPASGAARLASMVASLRAADDVDAQVQLSAMLAGRLELDEEPLRETLGQACEAGQTFAAQLA